MSNLLDDTASGRAQRDQETLGAAQARVERAIAAGHQPVAIDAGCAWEIDAALSTASIKAFAASAALHRAGLGESEVVGRICALARQLEAVRKSLAVQVFVR